MKILLDTNIAIWSLCDTNKVPKEIFEQIIDCDNEIYVSTASIWEIAIKSISKPEKIPLNELKFIEYCRQADFFVLPINVNHVSYIRHISKNNTKFVHKDPFDNMIVAQSVSENMKLYTSDKILEKYNYNNIEII